MTLTDAGPLVAVIDSDETNHERCRDMLDRLSLPLVTTWPAFTEAMHLVARAGGSRGTDSLWALVLSERLELVDLSRRLVERAAELMTKYADRPMALADATLVALAEERGTRRIFTLDADFHVYRLHGRRAFDVIP
ncbi:MAG TPA: PIN domain-containing protein [Actinomycetales bacterium]|nr:PIN domain-containing protein [Actinomycetales bacterium]